MHDAPGMRRTAKAAVIVLIVAYGALLRLAAITETFGAVENPRWVAGLQQAAAAPAWRPAALRWEPTQLFPHRDGPPTRYRSDPYTYLQYAREMRNFYAAHRREPLFPFTTKVFLWVLGNDDVAVSFASAFFSVLAIWATYKLGSIAFGYWTGAGAALLVAVEYDLITSGIQGWRDDAFTSAVLVTSIALLAVRRRPEWRSAVALGLAAAAACLIRITSLSFIVPAVLTVALAGRQQRRERLRGCVLAAAIAAALVAPFLANCWRVYGDPLYSINVHASVYQETEGQAGDASLTAREYLRARMKNEPVRTIDTVLYGLTVYPFANKWTGFDRWIRSAGWWLALSALVGLLLFVTTAEGRILIVVAVTSLVPYAATWKLISDWRFTEHVYPIFLIAATAGVAGIVRGLRMIRARTPVPAGEIRMRAAWLAGAAACVVVAWYLMTRMFPVAIVEESIRAGQPGLIMALDRDSAFFPHEWTPGPTDSLPTRVAPGWRAEIRVPFPVSAAYEVLLRVNPSAAPIRSDEQVNRIDFWLNGRQVGSCEPGSAADRFGACQLNIPADAVRPGMNHIVLATDQSQPRGFRIWYMRVQLARPTETRG